jgi:hypothetical protein
MRLCLVLALSSLTTILTCVRSASAEKIALVYDAVPGCPDRSRFADDLHDRTRTFEETSDPGTRSFRVVLRRTSATLTIDERDGSSSTRTITAATCEAAARALVLVAAQTIDPSPNTSTDLATSAEPSTKPEVAAPSPVDVRSKPNVASPLRVDSRAQDLPKPVDGTTDSKAEHAIGFGIGGGVAGFAAPAAIPVGRAFVEWRWERRGPFVPSIRVSGSLSAPGEVASGATRSTFTWTTGRLDLCPVRAGRVHGPFVLDACAIGEAGRIAVDGTGADRLHQPRRPWAAAGALARGGWRLTQAFSLEIEGGAEAPLLREDFVYPSTGTVYRAPRVIALAGVWLAIRLP